MQRRRSILSPPCAVLLAVAACLAAGGEPLAWGQAAVAVIANRTSETVSFSLVEPGSAPRAFRLAGGDNATLPLACSSRLTLTGGKAERSYTLSPDQAYVLFDRAGNVELTTIGLGERTGAPPLVLPPASGVAAAAQRLDSQTADGMVVVRVRIMVDEDERAARPVWEKRLRGRIADASQILERDCRIRLQVVDCGTWESDNSIHEFPKSLDEFERKVSPQERLTIGFTSQYTLVKGQTHLGGIHGPLARHLLVREWSQVITEPERLEVLLHELGHFFGAAHSPEPDSVMRPTLADRRARAAGFRIGLDPLNTLAVALVGDQLRRGEPHSLGDLPLGVQLRLRPIYSALDRAMPDDPNPRRFVGLIDGAGIERTALATAAVIAALEKIAVQQETQSPAAGRAAELLQSPDWRLRTAARLAGQLPAELQTPACLLAVSLSGPQRQRLVDHPLVRPICERVAGSRNAGPAQDPAVKTTESAHAAAPPSQRARIEQTLAAAALATCLGEQLADAAALADAGITNPTSDAIDLAGYADACAGCLLAVRLADPAGRLTLARLADTADLAAFLPAAAEELKLTGSRLTRADFERQFGSAIDERFLQWRGSLYRRIAGQAAHR